MITGDIEDYIQAAAKLSPFARTQETHIAFVKGARFMYQWLKDNGDPCLYSSIINHIE